MKARKCQAKFAEAVFANFDAVQEQFLDYHQATSKNLSAPIAVADLHPFWKPKVHSTPAMPAPYRVGTDSQEEENEAQTKSSESACSHPENQP